MTQTIRTTCSYCSVGCNFDATLNDQGVVTKFMPNATYPVNAGKACPKGFHLLTPFKAADRLTTPLRRAADGSWQAIGWDAALDEFVTKLQSIKTQHGPESVAFLSTGQLPLEEMAFLGALFKFGMGFLHCDGNTRQCMATAVVAYKQAFGFDAPPFSYEDLEQSDLMIFVGANPAVAHPVLWNRIKANETGGDMIVLDPRRTQTAEAATVHVPLKAKSDIVLLYGIARLLIERGWIDRDFIAAHTEGFEEFAAHVAAFTLERTAAATGLGITTIEDLAERIHRAKAMSVWWTMGVNQGHQAVRTAQAIINLCLITGHIGRPGTGPNSLTGQANAMGSRLFSNTTAMFALHEFTNPEHRAKMAELLRMPLHVIPEKNSLPYHRIMEEIDRGKIKALWVVCTNPAHSWIGKAPAIAALKKLDFLVVQDLYSTTDTAQLAHLLLPAAGSGEKNGTFINSERRFGIVQKVMDPPGEALPDFEIFRRIADRWGCGKQFAEWTDPEAVFRILQRTTAGRPCDITGIQGYAMLRERPGIQWPYPQEGADDSDHRRLFADGRFFTPSGRAKLLFDPITSPPEEPDVNYPFLLLTGRGSIGQWHTQTRTGKVDMINKISPAELPIQVSPDDAARLRLAKGDRVLVKSRRGQTEAVVVVTNEVSPGHVFMSMHYYGTNLLTYPVFDPYSFQPGYKYAAVSIERVPAPTP
ncbi:MAG TPA: nitrate reductase [Kiritimatiellia bacterium]|nr:nitrate reductase [Kiritimatiellia bacterium]HQF21295.1 nitrate reductase [Kiritimatiellia bacterium]HQG74308.1 nitrate reductase [Kiritimatiellia bacterium]HQM23425.1 nitrate reductase [Kiritimatiellia bacterium]